MTKYTLVAAALALMLAPSTPTISNVDPSSLAPSTKTQMLTITGQDLMPGLTLTISEPAGNTVVIQGKAIMRQTPTSFQASAVLSLAGTYSLVVTNTDGGVSPPFALPVKAQPPPTAPAIEKLTPAEPTKRPDAQQILVEGQRFASGLRAIVTDPMGADVTEVSVAKVSPNSFELTVRLEHSGEYSLVVSTSSGAVSNLRRFLVR